MYLHIVEPHVVLQIYSTKIYFLDLILENIWISFFFTTFCILIAINGTNFIDGLNGLVLGYYFRNNI